MLSTIRTSATLTDVSASTLASIPADTSAVTPVITIAHIPAHAPPCNSYTSHTSQTTHTSQTSQTNHTGIPGAQSIRGTSNQPSVHTSQQYVWPNFQITGPSSAIQKPSVITDDSIQTVTIVNKNNITECHHRENTMKVKPIRRIVTSRQTKTRRSVRCQIKNSKTVRSH